MPNIKEYEVTTRPLQKTAQRVYWPALRAFAVGTVGPAPLPTPIQRTFP